MAIGLGVHPVILYEDNHLLVVVKPPNVVVQADDTGDKDLLSILKEGIAKRHNKKGNVFLGLIHRLDRPVGGVMVFARTSKSAARLSEQVRMRSIQKTYQAVITGRVKPQATLKDYLHKDTQRNMSSVVSATTAGAKEAQLSYTTLGHTKAHTKQHAKALTRIEIQLHTGRSHQIRVQFASRGASLWGDNRYGTGVPGQQIALWATVLRFTHPTTKESLEFTSTPPPTEPWNHFNV